MLIQEEFKTQATGDLCFGRLAVPGTGFELRRTQPGSQGPHPAADERRKQEAYHCAGSSFGRAFGPLRRSFQQ
jgi:hypothetical protein